MERTFERLLVLEQRLRANAISDENRTRLTQEHALLNLASEGENTGRTLAAWLREDGVESMCKKYPVVAGELNALLKEKRLGRLQVVAWLTASMGLQMYLILFPFEPGRSPIFVKARTPRLIGAQLAGVLNYLSFDRQAEYCFPAKEMITCEQFFRGCSQLGYRPVITYCDSAYLQ